MNYRQSDTGVGMKTQHGVMELRRQRWSRERRDFPPGRDSSVGGGTDTADHEEGGRGGAWKYSDGGLVALGERAGWFSSWCSRKGVDVISSLLYGWDVSLLFGQGHKLRMGHEAVDGATGFWALQPLVQGATECVHHLNLGEREEELQEVSRSQLYCANVTDQTSESLNLGQWGETTKHSTSTKI